MICERSEVYCTSHGVVEVWDCGDTSVELFDAGEDRSCGIWDYVFLWSYGSVEDVFLRVLRLFAFGDGFSVMDRRLPAF